MTAAVITIMVVTLAGVALITFNGISARRHDRLSDAAYKSGWQTGYDAAEIALRAELNKGARWHS